MMGQIVIRFADINPNNPAAWENYITGALGVRYGEPAFGQWVYRTQMVMNFWQNRFRDVWLSRVGTPRTGYFGPYAASARGLLAGGAPSTVGNAWALNPAGPNGVPPLRPPWMPYSSWLSGGGGRLLARIGLGSRYERRMRARRITNRLLQRRLIITTPTP